MLDIREQMQQATSSAVCFSLEGVVLMGGTLFHPKSGLYNTGRRHECNFLHRLPLPSRMSSFHFIPSLILMRGPDQLLDHSRDCFGREKHAEYRDDMGGVGSFNRSNRTLYIGKMQESPDKNQTIETLMRHFEEWGKIVKCGSTLCFYETAD